MQQDSLFISAIDIVSIKSIGAKVHVLRESRLKLQCGFTTMTETIILFSLQRAISDDILSGKIMRGLVEKAFKVIRLLMIENRIVLLPQAQTKNGKAENESH
jgi:hypothetical protein